MVYRAQGIFNSYTTLTRTYIYLLARECDADAYV